MEGTNIINLDSPHYPGKWADIFDALGRACMAYEESIDE